MALGYAVVEERENGTTSSAVRQSRRKPRPWIKTQEELSVSRHVLHAKGAARPAGMRPSHWLLHPTPTNVATHAPLTRATHQSPLRPRRTSEEAHQRNPSASACRHVYTSTRAGEKSRVRGRRGNSVFSMRTMDPQVLGGSTIRLFSSCIECLLPLSASHGSRSPTHVIRLSQTRRLPAQRERRPRRSQASHPHAFQSWSALREARLRGCVAK